MIHEILIDLSHNEQVTQFPEHIFPDSSLNFHFNNLSDDLESFEFLSQYDLIIIGNPRQKNDQNLLFTPEELISLKIYVKSGGNLLITSGAHGDFDMDHSRGSLRVFYRLTGVQKYANAVLYSQNPQDYYRKKTTLKIQNFPQHPIFKKMEVNDFLLFARSTYLTLHPEITPKLIMYSPSDIYFHDFFTKQKVNVNRLPIMTAQQVNRGRIITIGNSEFLTSHQTHGIDCAANAKFLRGCIDWLINE